jgi:F420H(2)-dependent quinone reductase
MTATNTEQVKLPPRPLIRTFWGLHRALVRATGGRIGLQQPERGAKFGMLRLHTLGRRSGRERVAMIGYFEDGSNLVTLAMNGWGEPEPAWWLNLLSNPEATVDLPGGSRRVRARAARGLERERLWDGFREYPGWGADLTALMARRARETAIVVFEPVGATKGADR